MNVAHDTQLLCSQQKNQQVKGNVRVAPQQLQPLTVQPLISITPMPGLQQTLVKNEKHALDTLFSRNIALQYLAVDNNMLPIVFFLILQYERNMKIFLYSMCFMHLQLINQFTEQFLRLLFLIKLDSYPVMHVP